MEKLQLLKASKSTFSVDFILKSIQMHGIVAAAQRLFPSNWWRWTEAPNRLRRPLENSHHQNNSSQRSVRPVASISKRSRASLNLRREWRKVRWNLRRPQRKMQRKNIRRINTERSWKAINRRSERRRNPNTVKVTLVCLIACKNVKNG